MQMAISVDKNFNSRKAELLSYLRFRAIEYLNEIKQEFGERQLRQRATAINRALAKEKQQLAAIIRQNAEREDWKADTILRANLLLMHCTNVVMLESRNDVWPWYDCDGLRAMGRDCACQQRQSGRKRREVA